MMFPQGRRRRGAEEDRNGDDEPEAEGIFGKGDRDVHAPEAEEQGRDGQDNRNGGQEPHDQVQVVADDGGEDFHGAVDDAAVHLYHFDGLLVLDNDIFQQVFVFLVHFDGVRLGRNAPQAQQLFRHHVIAFQGRREIRQGFLQVQHAEQLGVFHGPAQVVFQIIGPADDVADVFQIQRRRLVEDLEEEPRLLERAEGAGCPGVEGRRDGIGLEADRHHVVRRENDAQRHGLIVLVAAQERDVDDDEQLVVVHFRTGFFFAVQGGRQEVALDARSLDEGGDFFGRRCHDVDPAAPFELGNIVFIHAGTGAHENLVHGTPSFPGRKTRHSPFITPIIVDFAVK